MKPVIRVAFLVLIGLGVAARPGAQERVLVRQASKHARVRDIRTPGTQPPAQPVLTADDLFDPDVVHDVLLTVHARDWLDLRENHRENTYDPADLRWRGLVVRNVGIRSRGTGSRSPVKPGLRVDFNRYSEAQEFLGRKSIVLDNHVQDPSMLKERLTMRFFSEMGIPAPRTAYARLFVNDALVGLYSIVESVDKKFLTRHFGENDGYLFEFTYTDPYGFEYVGPDLERYAELFAPRTHEFESMFTLYWPIREMTWTFSETPAGRFAEASSQFMDLHVFLKHVAVESFVADNDGLLGNWGMNNFYLYRRTRQRAGSSGAPHGIHP